MVGDLYRLEREVREHPDLEQKARAIGRIRNAETEADRSLGGGFVARCSQWVFGSDFGAVSRVASRKRGHGPFIQTLGPPQTPPGQVSSKGFNAQQSSAERQPIPGENIDAYKKALARTGEYVHMLGTMIGSNSVRVMRESIQPADTGRIWAGQEDFTCPGRVRLDAANPARENVFPGYKEGPDVNLKVGVLRIGDINFATVNGEVYSQIATRLKAEVPANKTIVVTLANGMANSGYIYSDEAYSHLTFQVIGSRLKPGCAEARIVSTALDLMHRSGE